MGPTGPGPRQNLRRNPPRQGPGQNGLPNRRQALIRFCFVHMWGSHWPQGVRLSLRLENVRIFRIACLPLNLWRSPLLRQNCQKFARNHPTSVKSTASEHAALQLIAEIGTDMRPGPTEKPWLTLGPNNKSSGGRLLRSRTPLSANRAAAVFCGAAR
jgi:hypothetical protein